MTTIEKFNLLFQTIIEDADNPKDFKKTLLKIIKSASHEEIREICEALRQMYEIELIDVIDEVCPIEQQEPFKAAGIYSLLFDRE